MTLPVVGTGATIVYYTDRKAGTIVAVSKTGHKITIREDHAIRTDGNGMSDSQTYRYEPYTGADEGSEWVAYRGADGSYRTGGKRVIIGERCAYHDYSF